MVLRRHESGFTLIECCIVSAMCLILLSIGFGTVSYMRSWLIHADVTMLYTVCCYAQQCALCTMQPQTIQLDLEHNCYHYAGRMFHLSPGVCFGFLPQTKGPPSHPCATLASPSTFAHNQITCSAHGIISSGTVYLADTNKSIMYALSNAVSHVSYMRMYRYKNSWQILSS